MPTHHHRRNVLDRDAKFLGDEGPVACRVQDTRHANHAILAELRDLERGPAHRIQRIGHKNQDAVRRILHRLFGGCPNNLIVSEK
jgi:hypothetical protein